MFVFRIDCTTAVEIIE